MSELRCAKCNKKLGVLGPQLLVMAWGKGRKVSVRLPVKLRITCERCGTVLTLP